MKTLKNLLIGAFLTLPVVASNAATIADSARGVEMRPASVVECCQVQINGKWFCLPC